MQSKPFYQSKTLIGALLMGAAMVCRIYQVDVSQAELDAAGTNLAQAIDGLAGFVGFVLVVWGRFKATTALKLSAKPE